MTREEGIESSIEKWVEGILPDLVAKTKKRYRDTYWRPCGYCKWVVENDLRMCGDCPLFVVHKGMKVCSDSDEYSWAHKTLKLAEQDRYDEALKCCDIVVSFMREDLKK